jgi:transposase
MAGKRRKYPREFKIEAVRRVIEGRETAAEIARALGIQPNMLYGWVRQFKGRGERSVSWERQTHRARRRNTPTTSATRGRYRRARHFKKSDGFFAKETR